MAGSDPKRVTTQPQASKPVAVAAPRPPSGKSFTGKVSSNASAAGASSTGKSLGGKAFPAKGAGGKPLANKPLAHKSSAKGKAATRTPSVPRERMTLDGPWEWAFDRMLGRKRAAEALAKQQAKQAAKPAGKRASDVRTPSSPEA